MKKQYRTALEVRRLNLRIMEEELMRTGKDLASSIIAIPDGINPRIQTQARVYLRRLKALEKIHLNLAIDETSEAAKRIDEMIPDVPKRSLLT